MSDNYSTDYIIEVLKNKKTYNTLIATLELVDSICDMALTYSDSEISKICWTDFVSNLDEEKCTIQFTL